MPFQKIKEKTLKIYLRNQRKPIQIVMKKEQANDFFTKVETEVQIIKIGNFVFNKTDFVCAIYE